MTLPADQVKRQRVRYAGYFIKGPQQHFVTGFGSAVSSTSLGAGNDPGGKCKYFVVFCLKNKIKSKFLGTQLSLYVRSIPE